MFNSLGRGILFLCLVIIGAGGWWYLVHQDRQVFGAVAHGQEVIDWQLAMIGYSATLLGVVLGALYRALHGQDKIVDFRAFLSSVARSTDLWAGFCASPLIFGLVLKATTGIAVSGLVVIALENGFCCHVIIDRLTIRKKKSSYAT